MVRLARFVGRAHQAIKAQLIYPDTGQTKGHFSLHRNGIQVPVAYRIMTNPSIIDLAYRPVKLFDKVGV